MKVVFLQNVPNVARAGEIKDVASGYGRNFLVPKKLAVPASSSAVSLMEAQSKIIARNQQQTEVELAELANQLEGRDVFLKAQVGAKDRLFGSITNADIAEASRITSPVVNLGIRKGNGRSIRYSMPQDGTMRSVRISGRKRPGRVNGDTVIVIQNQPQVTPQPSPADGVMPVAYAKKPRTRKHK